MRSMLSAKYDNIIKYYLRNNWPIPIDTIAELEGLGYIVSEYLEAMEQEVNGESEFYDSYWGS